MLDNYLRMVLEIFKGIDGSTDVVFVGAEGMPVIHVVELEVDAVVVVVTVPKEQVWFVDQLQVVVGQVIDIVLNHNLNQLTCIIDIVY